jgi:hypothetical protein
LQNETYTIKFNESNDFWESWNYTIKLNFWNSSEKDFFFFTQWDEKIYTKNDNILEVHKSWLSYPNWIWWEWENDFHEFEMSKTNQLSFDEKYDTILSIPIDSLKISNSWSSIDVILKYYRNYNCYNLDENRNKIDTFTF